VEFGYLESDILCSVEEIIEEENNGYVVIQNISGEVVKYIG
jgi:hypothetical protein